MFAEKIMSTDLIMAKTNEPIGEVIIRMHNAKLRMLPVLNESDEVVGIISTFCVLNHIVPDYLISGDLSEISFAPDMGILSREYKGITDKTVVDIMSSSPLLVHHTDSLISVAASIIGHNRHEYAIVVDKGNKLQGVISAGDILDALEEHAHEVSDA